MQASLDPVVEQPDRVGGFGRMPEIGENVDAAAFQLCRGWIFVLVDHVLVDRQIHQLMDIVVETGLAERGEVLPGIAIKEQLIAHQRMRDVGSQAALRHFKFGNGYVGCD